MVAPLDGAWMDERIIIVAVGTCGASGRATVEAVVVVVGADRRAADVLHGARRVYAVGNCTDPMQNVPLAIADGARAAIAINVRLIGEGVVQPVAS